MRMRQYKETMDIKELSEFTNFSDMKESDTEDYNSKRNGKYEW